MSFLKVEASFSTSHSSQQHNALRRLMSTDGRPHAPLLPERQHLDPQAHLGQPPQVRPFFLHHRYSKLGLVTKYACPISAAL